MDGKIHGEIISLSIDDYKCTLYQPPDYEKNSDKYPVVYILGEYDIAPIIHLIEPYFLKRDIIQNSNGKIKVDHPSTLNCREFILVGVEAHNWEIDFSPWKTKPLNMKSPAFGGGASVFLKSLSTKIKPYVDSNYRTLANPTDTFLIGYSLAGLTTLFALYSTTFAANYASCSGSLWYPDFIDYAQSHIPLIISNTTNERFCSQNKIQTNGSKSVSSCNIYNSQEAIENNILQDSTNRLKIYLSLGSSEKNSRNPLMSQVETCTLKTVEILKGQLPLSEVFFEYNDGGHFSDIQKRISKAIIFLLTERSNISSRQIQGYKNEDYIKN